MSKKFVPPKLAPMPLRNHCAYCGRMLTKEQVTKDHVIPLAHKGTNDPSNIVTACGRCNQLKADMLFDSFEDAKAFLVGLYEIRKQIKELRKTYVRKPSRSGHDLLRSLVKQAKKEVEE